MREFRQLREENVRLEHVVADLDLHRRMWRTVFGVTCRRCPHQGYCRQ